MVLFVAELFAQLPDALHKRVIGHGNVRPDGLIELLLRYEPSRVRHKVAQHLERLGRQFNILLADAQASTRQIERETVKPQNTMHDLIHADALRGASIAKS